MTEPIDLIQAVANLVRSSQYALTASEDNNFDAATRIEILAGAIESNRMHAELAPHVAEYTTRLEKALAKALGPPLE